MGILDGPRLGMKVIDQVVGKPDPRFDPRVKEQERLLDLETEVVPRGTQDVPNILLSDLEGMPFVTSMSDRTAAGGELVRINDTILARPVDLRGGQGFMHENPGLVWASAKSPVSNIMNRAAEMKAQTGIDPIFIPWRMAPTGGDFSTMTGEAMLAFASSAMGKGAKRSLNARIKKKIPDWAGVDDPASVEQWRNAPDAVRKELKNLMDTQFRGAGGLSIGEARLAVADPKQIDAMEGGIQEVGRIFADEDMVPSDHPSYPFGVPGEGLGRIVDEVGIYELLPEKAAQRGIADPLNPSAQDMRAMQMGAQTGIINETILKRLADRGVNVGGLAAAAVVGGGLLVAPADEANAAALKGLFTPKQSLTDTLSGYSDEALRMLQKSALGEGKADEAARYTREMAQRGSATVGDFLGGQPELSDVYGVPVRIADKAGEAVYDASKKEIRIPEWALQNRGVLGEEAFHALQDLRGELTPDRMSVNIGDLNITPQVKSAYDELAGIMVQAGVPLDDIPSLDRFRFADHADDIVEDMAFSVGRVSDDPATLLAAENAADRLSVSMRGNYRTPDEVLHDSPVEREAARYGRELESRSGGLDMSQEARMARAAEQGFDTNRVFVHGTPDATDIHEFDISKGMTGPISGNPIAKHGHFFFDKANADNATTYSDGAGGATIPVYLRMDNPYEMDMWRDFAPLSDDRGIVQEDKVSAFIDDLKAKGHDSIVLRGGDTYREYMVFDSDQIRSVNAAFDPESVGSRKLLGRATPGGMAAAGATAGAAALAPQEAEAAPILKALYRAHTPGRTERIRTGNDSWDGLLFAADNPESAAYYGDVMERLDLTPDAKILREGSKEFARLANGLKPQGMSLLDFSSEMVSRAKGAGYDAVHFSRQSDVGTAIINPDIVTGREIIGESSDWRVGGKYRGRATPGGMAAAAGAGAATIGYATSEFAAAESSLNATESDIRASSERFKALRKGKRAQRLSQELERVLAPVAGPAKALMDATEVMLVGVAGGIPGYLSELTGYVRGQDLEEAKAGGEALAGKLTGSMAEALGEDWDPQNPYLQGLAKAMEQGEKEFQDAYRMLGVENSVMKKGWDQLPERAQRIITGLADLAL